MFNTRQTNQPHQTHMRFSEYLEQISESSSEVKKLEKESKELSNEELYDELISMLKGKDYEDSVDMIDDIIKDPKLKTVLGLGFGGDLADTKLKITEKDIPARALMPSQNEIGFDETLKYIKEGKGIDTCFEKSVVIKRPVVTFNGSFIVDGHHRWSQIYVTNPKAMMKCIDVSGALSPIQMLKAMQATIGSNTGDLHLKKVQGKNLLKTSKADIEKYFKDISEKAVADLSKHYKNPVETLVENALSMGVNNPPLLNAPARDTMPQTSKDPELFKDLKKGVTKI